MKYEWRRSSDRAIVPQSAPLQRASCCELSSSRPAATAVVVATIVIARIVVVPGVGAPVVEAFFCLTGGRPNRNEPSAASQQPW